MANERALIDATLREHLPTFVHRVFQIVDGGGVFVPNWHIDAICHSLMRVYRGEVRRLIIEAPPRSLKSICASVAFAAFLLGNDPTHKLVCASYSGVLAGKFSRMCRKVMADPDFRRLFPECRIGDKDTESLFETTAGGQRFATSVEGTLTGIGADTIIIDDALKTEEAYSKSARDGVINWFEMTARQRLNNKLKGTIIVVSQRLHAEDLPGYLRQQGGWEMLSLPAIAETDESIPIGGGRVYRRKAGELLDPTHNSLDELERIRSGSSATFSAQYQQRPVPPDGEMVKLHWFKRFELGSQPMPPYSRIILSCDPAVKVTAMADYTALLTFAKLIDEYYLIDVHRAKLDFPSLRREIVRQARKWKADDIIIEDQGAGASLIQQLKHDSPEGLPRPIGFRPKGDKVMRLATVSHLIDQGLVYLPNDAPWLAEFLDELLQFPGGAHDDQVDALSQFLAWVTRPRGTAERVYFSDLGKNKSRPQQDWKWE